MQGHRRFSKGYYDDDCLSEELHERGQVPEADGQTDDCNGNSAGSEKPGMAVSFAHNAFPAGSEKTDDQAGPMKVVAPTSAVMSEAENGMRPDAAAVFLRE